MDDFSVNSVLCFHLYQANMIVFARTGYTDKMYCFRDLDLDPMTLIYKLDLDISRTYLGQGFQRLEHYRQTDRQTDTDVTDNITVPSCNCSQEQWRT